MNFKILFLLLVVSSIQFAQKSPFDKDEPSGAPYIHYYKFYDGIQMIEFDFLTAYHDRVNYLEQAQPRALTWEMVLGPPHSNVYLFRNEKGEIVKSYGGIIDSTSLMSVEESKKIAIRHNSFGAQMGAFFGFSRIMTRYFPYYLLNEYTGIGIGYSTGLFGLIDSLGNEVLPAKYTAIWKHDRIFITRKDSLNELRDFHLKVKFSSTKYQLQPSYHHSNCVDIYTEDKRGLMDSTGKIIVPCEYSMLIESFNEYGMAKVTKAGRVGFVNRKGKEVIQCKFQNVGVYSEGLLNARLNDKWGYIDTTGKTIISHKYDIGISFQEGLARVAIKKNYDWFFGFIDKDGNEVIPLIYSNAKDFTNGYAEVMLDGKWFKIDKTGKKK